MSRGPSQATILVGLADNAELFHTPDGETYASIPVDGHWENARLKDRAFRHYLMQLFYEVEGKAPSSQAVQSAVNTLIGKALYKSPTHSVYIRVAGYGDEIFIDLANKQWQAVRITKDGWTIVDNPPVKFRRPRGMLPLPYPEPGGTINNLKPFINYDTEDDFVLFVGHLVSSLRPQGPYSVLEQHGEQGSGKTTNSRGHRSLIDPNKAPLRSEPRESRDLMIAASNGWLLCFDNISYLTSKMSDDLCRLATGGGFTTRELYTDDEEAIFDATRPVLINGITEVASRPDLLDRIIILHLPRINKRKRRTEDEFWPAFEEARPRILGALYTAIATALRNINTTKLEELPRMADLVKWVTAAEPAFGWKSGTFLFAYNQNRVELNQIALEASVISQPIRDLLENKVDGVWEGTAASLLQELPHFVQDELKDGRSWPKNARSLSGQLERISPNLRAIGVSIERWRTSDRNRERMITLKKMDDSSVHSVQSLQHVDNRTESDASDDKNQYQSHDPAPTPTIQEISDLFSRRGGESDD